jgi:hypothetical protein
MPAHRFIGDHQAPEPRASVRARGAERGTRRIPEALQSLMAARISYVRADSRPDVHVESLSGPGQQEWRIAVPVGNRLNGARAGRALERHSAARFLGEVDESVSCTSHRPGWIDMLPVPRMALDYARMMRRLDGTHVQPLWVYDSRRYPFQDDSWPWGLAGRIFNNRGESGTGTLIGNRLVLTAGHMVPWGDAPWWMLFVPACDLYFGNSGGPCFAWWNNGTDPRIVGVVSGQETEYQFPFPTHDDNVFASGDGFVNLCAWGRSNWT